MLQFDPAADVRSRHGAGRFILYMEGPGDRGILRAWSYRLYPSRARQLFDGSVILGGRQPGRAVAHFRSSGGTQAGLNGLCVLDRDDGSAASPDQRAEPGLEFFTWSRRHIESYLLVPDAIRRALRLRPDDRRIERVLHAHVPAACGEDTYRAVDAKRLLGPRGALPLALGRPLPLAQIARATRESELHADVHALFARLRECFDRIR